MAGCISGTAPDGSPTEVDVAEGRHLVAFLSGGCKPCRMYWKGLGERRPELAGTPVVIVTPDPSTEPRRGIARLAPKGVPVVMSTTTWFGFGAGAAPWFAVVDDGTVTAGGNAPTWADLAALVRS
ncbi:MAG TPA: hypothetical protein VKV06_01435 [Acidimicrobiales bacterium]|nr:hypothetical protein [Acidimicrobiales bacterium]